jgi:hypothetical protein
VTDTTFVKDRIKANEKFPGNKAREAMIVLDNDYLGKLRQMYKGDTVTVGEFGAWKDRNIMKDNKIDHDVVSPLNVLKNFTMYLNKDKSITYKDIYDFNEFERFVPGEPFNIQGIINNFKIKNNGK